MALDLQGETILKISFLIILLGLLIYLVTKLMIMGETIDIMIKANNTFI